MKISYLREKRLAAIEELISGYKFNGYRKYRLVNKEAMSKYLFMQIEDLVLKRKESAVIIAEDDKDILGLASLVYLPWDSKIFGFKVAKIAHLITNGKHEDAFRIKNSLISFILQICGRKRIKHLSCRISTDDILSVHALEANGFRIIETLMTYIFNKLKHREPRIKDLYRVRSFRKRDLDAIIKLAENSILKSRFYMDSNFPKEKVNILYKEWVRNYCCRFVDSKIFIAEKQNIVSGFLIYRKNLELEKICGIKIFGNGLSAVCPTAKGAYPALIKAAIKYQPKFSYDIGEFDTQINNYEVIRIWQRFGLDFVESKYTFHKWL